MIITKEQTWQYKLKRVFKYMVVLLVAMIVCTVANGIIKHLTDNPIFSVKEDWRILQGAMMYRLISTWSYK